MTSSLSFSVVIPTYNRPQKLSTCLKFLADLDYPREKFEVIVVDDGGETLLNDVVAAYDNKLSITLIRQTNGGPGAARNRGVEAATGDYLAFTDDDCMPHSDWLSQFAARLAQNPDALVGGHVLNALTENLYSSASQQLIDYLYDYYHNSHRGISFFTSNNLALSKVNFLDIGGFDSSLTVASEDRELCDRWLQKGSPMIYAPEVQISHAHDLTLQSFWKQHFSYGRGAYRFHQARAKRDAAPIKVEPLLFYTNLLTYPLNQSSQNHSGLLLSGLFFLSQLAMTIGFFRERLSVSEPAKG